MAVLTAVCRLPRVWGAVVSGLYISMISVGILSNITLLLSFCIRKVILYLKLLMIYISG